MREILQWTSRLRPLARPGIRSRLLLCKGVRGVTAWSTALAKHVRGDFLARHGLAHFSLASIRPSVLSAFYRASGDLREVKTVANHQHIGTTVRYVEAPEVEAAHRARIAAIQQAFLGHVSRPSGGTVRPGDGTSPTRSAVPLPVPPGSAVSMFGFGCKDPLAGIAPGTRPGELCTNFLGCFTCPNAIITGDAASLARLSQARDHLRSAAAQIHPVRWEAIYAPLLRILEEDILTRFSADELAVAAPLVSTLPPLPELR